MSQEVQPNMKWLVFSDLDGTLLDEQSYSFREALPALDYLAEKSVPVILCTSKTSAEVATICKQLHLEHPFIVENGSAVIIPKNYFNPLAEGLSLNGLYYVQVLGKTYSHILSFFEKIKNKFNIPALGFRDMSEKQLLELTGLKRDEITYAQKREYSEPFILTDSFQFDSKIYDYVDQNGFRLLRGNRFYHLLGATDKGNAVHTLRAMYEQFSGHGYQTIAIGDSPNDLEMLQAVDQPVLVKKPDGKYADIDPVQKIFRTEGIGPLGWQEAVFKFLPTEELK